MTFQKDSKGSTPFKEQESRWSTQLICSRSACHREGSRPRTTSCTHVSFPQAAVPGARPPRHEEAGGECQNKEGQGSSDYLFLLFHTEGLSAGSGLDLGGCWSLCVVFHTPCFPELNISACQKSGVVILRIKGEREGRLAGSGGRPH